MTLESKIAALLAVGLAAESVQAAFEVEYPETMPGDDPRRKTLAEAKAFDANARARMSDSIRTVCRLMRVDDR